MSLVISDLFYWFFYGLFIYRGILCKGSKYPPTLPRPNVNILPFEIPLCEMSTEKGTIEVS